MGGKVTSGKNCEKQLGSKNCQDKNCCVRIECENGKLHRTTRFIMGGIGKRRKGKYFKYYSDKY